MRLHDPDPCDKLCRMDRAVKRGLVVDSPVWDQAANTIYVQTGCRVGRPANWHTELLIVRLRHLLSDITESHHQKTLRQSVSNISSVIWLEFGYGNIAVARKFEAEAFQAPERITEDRVAHSTELPPPGRRVQLVSSRHLVLRTRGQSSSASCIAAALYQRAIHPEALLAKYCSPRAGSGCRRIPSEPQLCPLQPDGRRRLRYAKASGWRLLQ